MTSETTKKLRIRGTLSGIEHPVDGVILIDNQPHYLIKATDNIYASVIRAVGAFVDTKKPIALLVRDEEERARVFDRFPILPIKVVIPSEVKLVNP